MKKLIWLAVIAAVLQCSCPPLPPRPPKPPGMSLTQTSDVSPGQETILAAQSDR